MIYTPEQGSQATNRMSPELNKEVAERIAELLASLPTSPTATEEDVEKAKQRMREDA